MAHPNTGQKRCCNCSKVKPKPEFPKDHNGKFKMTCTMCDNKIEELLLVRSLKLRRQQHCYTHKSFGCVHCGLFEHEFTTHCPRKLVGYKISVLVQNKVMDFVDDQWVMNPDVES